MEPYETYYYDAKIKVIESRVKVLELERDVLKAELKSLPSTILSICFFVSWAVYSVDFSGDVLSWKDNSFVISFILFGLFIFFFLRIEKGSFLSPGRRDLEKARKDLSYAEESYRDASKRYIEFKRSLREYGEE